MKRRSSFNKGFTLMEALIAVGLLSFLSVVALSVITNLVRSAVKSQASVDIEQISSFVLLKMENDIKKSYYASVDNSKRILTLNQGSTDSPVTIIYTLGAVGCNGGLNCVTVTQPDGSIVKLTDDTVDSSTNLPTNSAVSIDLDPALSNFSLVTDSPVPPQLPKPLAVNIRITFLKSSAPPSKLFDAKSTVDTTVVLRGTY